MPLIPAATHYNFFAILFFCDILAQRYILLLYFFHYFQSGYPLNTSLQIFIRNINT